MSYFISLWLLHFKMFHMNCCWSQSNMISDIYFSRQMHWIGIIHNWCSDNKWIFTLSCKQFTGSGSLNGKPLYCICPWTSMLMGFTSLSHCSKASLTAMQPTFELFCSVVDCHTNDTYEMYTCRYRHPNSYISLSTNVQKPRICTSHVTHRVFTHIIIISDL